MMAKGLRDSRYFTPETDSGTSRNADLADLAGPCRVAEKLNSLPPRTHRVKPESPEAAAILDAPSNVDAESVGEVGSVARVASDGQADRIKARAVMSSTMRGAQVNSPTAFRMDAESSRGVPGGVSRI
jgi:cell pole-organizing protein PopZ